MRLKILIILALSLTLFSSIVVFIAGLSIRDLSIQKAQEDAHIAFFAIRLQKEDFYEHANDNALKEYLNEFLKYYQVDNIWLSNKDNTNPYIQSVFKNKKESMEIIENIREFIIYTHIPYIENDEVVGVVSIAVNAIQERHQWLHIMLWVLVCVVIFIFLKAWILKRIFEPYLLFYRSLYKVMLDIEKGNFEQHINTNLQDEVHDIASWINRANKKIDLIIKGIESKISLLMDYQKERYDHSPFIRIQEAINELVDIYQFKQKLENCENLENIEQLVIGLFNQLDLPDVIIVEMVDFKERIIYPDDPLAFRRYMHTITTNNLESLKNAPTEQSEMELKNEFIPISIDNKNGLFVVFCISSNIHWHFLFALKEYRRISKRIIPLLSNYFDIIRTTLQSRYLFDLLRENSQKDPLTKLNNRGFLEEFSKNVTFQAKHISIDYAILMVDIDFFKRVNDNYGHNIGDYVLCELARVFKQEIRKSDLAVRYGGEEFLVLLLSCEQEGAIAVGTKIKECFEHIVFESDLGDTFSCTLSIGVSLFPHDANSVSLAIKYADIALYQAKNRGRNQIICFSQDMLPKDFNPSKI